MRPARILQGSFPVPESMELTTALMPVVYHAIGGTDFRIHDKRPLGFAHSVIGLSSHPFCFCVPLTLGFGSSALKVRYCTEAGELFNQLTLLPVVFLGPIIRDAAGLSR